MTHDEAIRIEVHRVTEAADAHQAHLAHIRHLAVHRLRNAHEDRPQFGAVPTGRADLPAAA